MVPNFSLGRFCNTKGQTRLCLVLDEQAYDLSVSGRPAYASMQAWLQAAAGRVPEALAGLRSLAAELAPIGSAEDLLSGALGLSVLPPLDTQEVWACGVTYEMSRSARMRESEEPTIYGRVYDAPRPEIFFKATPHRVVGPGQEVAIREDSTWDVPEPEMVLVVTPKMEIVGYTVGNDMSSRSIEGENPLYLPQAKVYDRCCALGPLVRLAAEDFDPLDQVVTCKIWRDGAVGFEGETHTAKIHRPLGDLVKYLGRCNSFPEGVFVLTGTGIVPPDTFSLAAGDIVEIIFDGLGTLTNPVMVLQVQD